MVKIIVNKSNAKFLYKRLNSKPTFNGNMTDVRYGCIYRQLDQRGIFRFIDQLMLDQKYDRVQRTHRIFQIADQLDSEERDVFLAYTLKAYGKYQYN